VRDPRWPLPGPDARRVEQLLGLQPYSLRGVERRRNGDYALKFRTQRVGDAWPRVLRIPAKRVHGYRQRSAHVRPRDARARVRANQRRFAYWLMWKLGIDAPIVQRAIYQHDLTAIDELRRAILALSPPDYVVLIASRLPRDDELLFVPEGWVRD
jgi:hypothetical protein